MLQRFDRARPSRWILIALAAFPLSGSLSPRDGNVKISGIVRDFDGKALDGVSVILKDKQFKSLYETLSDKDGRYALSVPKGMYYCLYAIRPPEYRVSRLEYWAWNVPAYEDLEIDPRYDRMEIYGVNVFEPQVTPHETYMVYFRPMSLAKSRAIVEAQKVDARKFEQADRAEGLLRTAPGNVLDMAPATVTAGELTVEVNGAKAEILGITKTTEYARGISCYGYLVQVLKPKGAPAPLGRYDRITIVLRSAETGEAGMGEGFIERK